MAERARDIFEKFKSSEFYRKYEKENPYVIDRIMREVFGDRKRDVARPLKIKEKTYLSYVEYNAAVMGDFLNLFVKQENYIHPGLIKAMVQAFYIDPDGAAVRHHGDEKIDCTADGLISINRLLSKEGLTQEAILSYVRYRMVPVFYFPKEDKGINQRRFAAFGDRIDYTLYDLKQYFRWRNEAEDNPKLKIHDYCHLAMSYEGPKTRKWLDSFESFDQLVDWYGVKGIFVDEQGDVYDLSGYGSQIIRPEGGEKLSRNTYPGYSTRWTYVYYINLKRKIDKFADECRCSGREYCSFTV